jgi:hypothetical protein
MDIFYWAVDSMKRWLSRISELNHSRTTQIVGIGQKFDNFCRKVFFSAFIRSQKNWPLGVSNRIMQLQTGNYLNSSF